MNELPATILVRVTPESTPGGGDRDRLVGGVGLRAVTQRATGTEAQQYAAPPVRKHRWNVPIAA